MATYSSASFSAIQPNLSHPISILDVLIPGFTGIFAAAEQLLAGKLNNFAGLLCVFSILVTVARHASGYLRELAETHLTSTIHVPDNDEAYDMLLAWILSQPFAEKARSSLGSVRPRRRRYADDCPPNASKSISYSPWNGSFLFWYKNHPLVFRCQEKEVRFSIEEKVSISCLGWSTAIIKELFNECREGYLKGLQNKTSVFEHRKRGWERLTARDIRPLSTVVMSKKEKDELLGDVEGFLDPNSRRWYSCRKVPYRRGYLLYGPPGTGKSSVCSSIAGYFHLDIYIISLASISEDELQHAFTELPEKCMVLLEDVDAVSTTESRDAKEDDAAKRSKSSPEGMVPLSLLLNVLDGITSQEGRVLFMTTNHLEKLDSALIRPGRVDKKIEFRLADKDITTELFHLVYKQTEDEMPEKRERAKANEAVEQLAKDFVAMVPELEFSSAEIVSFLVAHRQSATMALDKAQQWMDRTREEKLKLKRAESWVQPERITSEETDDDDD